jgi:metal-responsive CopG/Arc/MetJ family transcriptional regulator
MEQEKRVQISVRLPESFAREFKSLCVLNGVSIQEVLEDAAKEYVRKKKPE